MELDEQGDLYIGINLSPESRARIQAKLEQSQPYFEATLDLPYTLVQLSSATGRPHRAFKVNEHRALREESKSCSQRFTSASAAALINFAISLLGEADTVAPENLETVLAEWADQNLHSIYSTARETKGENFSYFHRFIALLYEAKDIYGMIVSRGGKQTLENYQLSLEIALKSKSRNASDDIDDYGFMLYAFGIWKFDYIDYKGIFVRTGVRSFADRLSTIQGQIKIVHAYFAMPQELKGRLESQMGFGGVSLDALIREYLGINPIEKRFSLEEMAQIHKSKVPAISKTIQLIIGMLTAQRP